MALKRARPHGTALACSLTRLRRRASLRWQLPNVTEIDLISQSDYVAGLSGEATRIAAAILTTTWDNPMYRATTFGVGADNPTSSSELTPLQARGRVLKAAARWRRRGCAGCWPLFRCR